MIYLCRWLCILAKETILDKYKGTLIVINKGNHIMTSLSYILIKMSKERVRR